MYFWNKEFSFKLLTTLQRKVPLVVIWAVVDFLVFNLQATSSIYVCFRNPLEYCSYFTEALIWVRYLFFIMAAWLCLYSK